MSDTISFSLINESGIDPSLRGATLDMLTKLMADPTAPGLHKEPIAGAADRRLRSVRVNKQYRALVFETRVAGHTHFALLGVYNHDEAYEKARTVTMRVNPVNGITEIIRVSPEPIDSAGEKDTEAYVVPESVRKRQAAERAAREQAEREVAEAETAQAGTTQADAAQVDTTQAATGQAPGATTPSGAVSTSGTPGQDDGSPRTTPQDAGATSASEEDTRIAIGYSPEELRAELGLDPQISQRALAARTDGELLDLIEGLPGWMSEAYLSLAAGVSIADTRAALGFDELAAKRAETGDDEDAQLIAGLEASAARMDFRLLGGDDLDELQEAISGDFDAWRVFLHPSQQGLVDRTFSGAGRVIGGAGTGKTVVVVHRADRLVRTTDSSGEHPRVLLTTFTRTLGESLKALMNQLDPEFPEASWPGDHGLWIAGIDQLALNVTKKASEAQLRDAFEAVLGTPVTGPAKPLNEGEPEALWKDAIDLVGEGLPEGTANARFLADEYETVVIGGGLTTLAEYRRASRPGRGAPLGRAQRKAVWEVMQTFQSKCIAEQRYPFPVICALAAHLVPSPEEGALFDHALIDEAQDFHAGHWRFLRAAVAPGPNDIFFAEDSHQRIYGNRLVLERYGIPTRGRASTKLHLNYRTTRENLRYAVQMLDGSEAGNAEEWTDSAGEPDSLAGYRSARSGPDPQVLVAMDQDEELDYAAEAIRTWCFADTDTHVGVLVRTGKALNRAVSGLSERLVDDGIEVVNTRNAAKAAGARATVMTMHSAKGMEFNDVVIMGMNDGQMPLHWVLRGLGEHERNAQLQRERALLYVAASRARDSLLITSSGKMSEMVPGWGN
ncbi:3'-5' exonuclease [Corynebacterium frankenforstense]